MSGQIAAYIAGAILTAVGWVVVGALGRKAWDKSTGRAHERGGR